jgi:hypothetical protein
LKAYRSFGGDEAYAKTIRSYVKEVLAAGEFAPLDTITDEESIGETYRYRLGPLLLLALENYAGSEPLRKTFRRLVSDPPSEAVSYPALRNRLLAAGARDADLERFERDCLHKPVISGCVPTLSEVRLAPSR